MRGRGVFGTLTVFVQFLAEFQKTDKDGDGLIDRSEWKDEFGDDEAFDAYDLNGDGDAAALICLIAALLCLIAALLCLIAASLSHCICASLCLTVAGCMDQAEFTHARETEGKLRKLDAVSVPITQVL